MGVKVYHEFVYRMTKTATWVNTYGISLFTLCLISSLCLSLFLFVSLYLFHKLYPSLCSIYVHLKSFCLPCFFVSFLFCLPVCPCLLWFSLSASSQPLSVCLSSLSVCVFLLSFFSLPSNVIQSLSKVVLEIANQTIRLRG